jgi:subtilisin family serine protease
MSICKIMPLRPANSTDDEVESAIIHAANNGANVVSMSFGWYQQPTDPSLSEINVALDYASQKNLVICAATRNDGLPTIAYPANYSVVIACGASNYADARCENGDFPSGNDGSNFGSELSVVAPGSLLSPDTYNNRPGIPTTFPGGQYDPAFWGTSAATPQIAGLAGLLMSRWPHLKQNPCAVRQIIERTADKVPESTSYNETKSHGPWWNQMGYGRINVHRALTEGQQYAYASCTSENTPPAAPSGLQIL